VKNSKVSNNVMPVVTSNISRLSLHDSSFEAVIRYAQTIELVVDWAKLTDFREQNIGEVIIMGRTKVFLKEISDECFKIYKDDNSIASIHSFPADIVTGMEVIEISDVSDDAKTAVIGGMYKECESYSWAEWNLKFDAFEVCWSAFVTHTEWQSGKLPINQA
jgi:hypothetical protein